MKTLGIDPESRPTTATTALHSGSVGTPRISALVLERRRSQRARSVRPSPKSRAVLILRDVLRFSAAETASLLDDSVPAVNSALQRARATMQRFQRSGTIETASADATEQALVRRFIDAHEQASPPAVIAILREDARLTISPAGLCWDGRDDITPDFIEGMGAFGEFRGIAIRANHQPAVANYLRRWDDSEYRAFTVTVLGIDNG